MSANDIMYKKEYTKNFKLASKLERKTAIILSAANLHCRNLMMSHFSAVQKSSSAVHEQSPGRRPREPFCNMNA